jgi:hypothetical protein
VNAPQLRVLGVGEMLDVALKIYWRNAWMLFRLVVLIVAPVSVLTTLLTLSATPLEEDFFTVDETTGEPILADDFGTSVGTAVAGFGLAAVLAFLASTLATAACFKAVADAYLGAEPSWRVSLSYVVRRLHSVLWVTFLVGLVTIVGLILCILPGIYLWVGCGVAIPVLLTENVRGSAALGRSRALVRGHWWRTFGVLLLGAILTAIVGGAIAGLAGALSFIGDPESPASIVASILGDTVSQTLTVPFTAALVTVLYVDLRVRKEAFDLQLLSQQLGVEPRPEHAEAVEVRWPQQPEPGEKPPFWPPPPGWQPRQPDDGS